MDEMVFLSLGSDLGDREAVLKDALRSIAHYPRTQITALSSLYETEPVAVNQEQDARTFFNLCCAVVTGLDPFSLLSLIHETEQDLGRTLQDRAALYARRRGQAVPRTIDIDILLYGERILFTRALVIPHPLLHERRFVLMPLAEIAGSTVHPLFRLTVRELNDKNGDRHFVKTLRQFTV